MEKWVCHSWHVLLSPNVWRNFSLFFCLFLPVPFSLPTLPRRLTVSIPWRLVTFQDRAGWQRIGHRNQLTEINEDFQLHLLMFIASSSDNSFALAVHGFFFFFFFDGEKVFHFFWDNLGQQAPSFLTYLHYLAITESCHAPPGQDPGAVVAVPPNAVAPAISQNAAVGILFPFAFAPPPHNILPQFPVNCPDFSITCQNITRYQNITFLEQFEPSSGGACL